MSKYTNDTSVIQQSNVFRMNAVEQLCATSFKQKKTVNFSTTDMLML